MSTSWANLGRLEAVEVAVLGGVVGGSVLPAAPDDASQARPRVRMAWGWSWPRAGAVGRWSLAQGCQWRVLSASVLTASRRRLSQAQRKQATLRLPDSTATGLMAGVGGEALWG